MKVKALTKVNKMVYNIYTMPVMSLPLLEGKNKGTCSYVDKAIYLSQDVSGEELLNLIIHELTHAYIYEYSQQTFSIEHTWNVEDLCVFMENYGLQIITESQRIYKDLTVKE